MWDHICWLIPIIYDQPLSLLPHKHKQHKKIWTQKLKPVLPSLEEMVKADRQKSTATAFRSMTAEGMKGRSRKQLFIHTRAAHLLSPTHQSSLLDHCSLLSLWCWVSVLPAAAWMCVRKLLLPASCDRSNEHLSIDLFAWRIQREYSVIVAPRRQVMWVNAAGKSQLCQKNHSWYLDENWRSVEGWA